MKKEKKKRKEMGRHRRNMRGGMRVIFKNVPDSVFKFNC